MGGSEESLRETEWEREYVQTCATCLFLEHMYLHTQTHTHTHTHTHTTHTYDDETSILGG